MANVVYPKARKAAWSGDLDLLADNLEAVAVDLADYTYSAAHEFLSDVPAGARIATSGNLAGKTIADDGMFDCDDIIMLSVTGDQFEALIIYKDTGVEGTSRLVAFIDAADAGLPFTPNGGNVTFVVNEDGLIQL